ncbi:hypothetical protein ACQP1G_20250 [Nocardia sp. CA-107356]|uniref:hypothetical protein n=1 Tax=Nocardia sp. CA-107356 TaxID=3239972 RepID=UPI003D90C071
MPAKAAAIQSSLRAEQLGQADIVTGAYAVTVRTTVAVLRTLNEQIKILEGKCPLPVDLTQVVGFEQGCVRYVAEPEV